MTDESDDPPLVEFEYDSDFWDERDEVARKFWFITGASAATFFLSGYELLGASFNYNHLAAISAIILVAGAFWMLIQ